MGRLDEALRVAEELLADIELKRLKASEIVLKASRLARLVSHDDLLAFLELERNGYPNDGSANDWLTRAGRWAEDEKFFSISLSQVESHIDAAQRALIALARGGNYSGEYALVAGREHDANVNAHAHTITVLAGITGQVVSTIYEIVVEIYHELLFSELQMTLFADTQTKVDGALSAASGSALDKIERVSERLRDGDPESISQALTTCRRLIDSCADHLFPATGSEYDLGGGTTLKVGQQQVLNRLQAYSHTQQVSKSRRDRLRQTIAALYGRCSAGTHAEVTAQEARFVFLQTYIALGELLTLDGKSSSS